MASRPRGRPRKVQLFCYFPTYFLSLSLTFSFLKLISWTPTLYIFSHILTLCFAERYSFGCSARSNAPLWISWGFGPSHCQRTFLNVGFFFFLFFYVHCFLKARNGFMGFWLRFMVGMKGGSLLKTNGPQPEVKLDFFFVIC